MKSQIQLNGLAALFELERIARFIISLSILIFTLAPLPRLFTAMRLLDWSNTWFA